jgi:hypothetical protein
LVRSFINPEDGGDMFLQNVGWFTEIQCVTSQKTMRYISVDKTSGPVWEPRNIIT